MSILIKGVDMPENCHECEFVDILPTCPCSKMADEDFWKNVSLAVEGHKDCPLVPVPPHGRLIDADAEIEVWDMGYDGVPHAVKTTVSRFLLSHLNGKVPPTIIPAEEGE